jgi:universal stress protein A
MFAPQRILVPTDFSSYSDNALKYALDMAKQYHAKIFLVHVIDEYIQQCIDDYCLSHKANEEFEQASVATSADKLQQQCNRVAEGSPDVEISTDVKHGVPYEQILREQKDKDIDLIVLSSHGRTGIMRILIGSVAEKVLRGAMCPVLFVRA